MHGSISHRLQRTDKLTARMLLVGSETDRATEERISRHGHGM